MLQKLRDILPLTAERRRFRRVPVNLLARYMLADGREFLMGARFSSADILLTTCLEWAVAYGVGICDNAQPYLERIKKRDAYQRAVAANVPMAPITPPAKV